VAMTRHVPGRGRERQPPRVAPEVLVAAGLGLIGPVILDQPGGRVSSHTLSADQDAA